MSNPDSFIDEVSEEVRRDRLYALLRRYGWIGIAVVLLLVGGAAFTEWRAAQQRTAAQAFGDALNAALAAEDPADRAAALAAVPVDAAGAPLVALLTAGEAQGADQIDAAADSLRGIVNDAETPDMYRQLAALKLAMLLTGADTVDERRTLLEGISAPGAPFALLAREQLAMIEAETGNVEAAIATLTELMQNNAVSPGLRQRASQLIVALGGAPS